MTIKGLGNKKHLGLSTIKPRTVLLKLDKRLNLQLNMAPHKKALLLSGLNKLSPKQLALLSGTKNLKTINQTLAKAGLKVISSGSIHRIVARTPLGKKISNKLGSFTLGPSPQLATDQGATFKTPGKFSQLGIGLNAAKNNMFMAKADKGNGTKKKTSAPKKGETPQQKTDALIKKGQKSQKDGNLKKANECFEKALELDKKNADAWNGIGAVFCNKGDPEKGMEYINKALILNPNHLKALSNKASILSENGDQAAALYYFSQAYKMDPNDNYSLGKMSQIMTALTEQMKSSISAPKGSVVFTDINADQQVIIPALASIVVNALKTENH